MDAFTVESPDVSEPIAVVSQHNTASQAAPSISERFTTEVWGFIKLKMDELHKGLQEFGLSSDEVRAIINMAFTPPLANVQGYELDTASGFSQVTPPPLASVTTRQAKRQRHV
jgi:hypothetical protein